MASDLQKVLDDAAAFQEGLNAFENTDFSKKCPTTKLVFKELVDPSIPDEELDDDELDDETQVIGTSIVVRDYCTDLPVPNAQVTVDGTTYNTNADGLIYIGRKTPNATYPLVITAAGYTDSVSDTLNNDEITIPAVPDNSGSTGGSVVPF